MNSTITNTVSMNGFMIVNNNTNTVVFFGSRTQCRDYRRAQGSPSNYSGAQRINVDLPTS